MRYGSRDATGPRPAVAAGAIDARKPFVVLYDKKKNQTRGGEFWAARGPRSASPRETRAQERRSGAAAPPSSCGWPRLLGGALFFMMETATRARSPPRCG